MASSGWTLKAEHGSDTRRLRQWLPDGEEPTLEAVSAGMAKLFDLSSEQLAQLRFLYKDGSEEWAALTSDSFSDAMCAATESRTLRVKTAEEAEPFADASQSVPPEAAGPWGRLRGALWSRSEALLGRLSEDERLNETVEKFQRAVQEGSGRVASHVERGQQQLSENVGKLQGIVAESREQLGASTQAAQQVLTEGAERATTAVRERSEQLSARKEQLRATVQETAGQVQEQLGSLDREQVASGARQLREDVRSGTSQVHRAVAGRISRNGEGEEPGAAANGAASVVLAGAALVWGPLSLAGATVGTAVVGRRSRLASEGGAAATAGAGDDVPAHDDAEGTAAGAEATTAAGAEAAEVSPPAAAFSPPPRVASEESAEAAEESATPLQGASS